MADVTISELTPGAPADNNIIPYSTGTDTLGVPVSAMFQNTSVIKTNTLGGLNGLQLYTNKLTRKSFWFIEKTMATRDLEQVPMQVIGPVWATSHPQNLELDGGEKLKYLPPITSQILLILLPISYMIVIELAR